MNVTTRTPQGTSTPQLESGSAADTPPGDNLLADFLAAESAAFRDLAAQAGGRSRVDDELGLSMGDAGSPSYFGNVAHVTRPIEPRDLRETVRRIRRFYSDDAPGATGRFLVFTPWSLGDVRDDGFELAGHPPLMLRPAGIDVPAINGPRIEWARTPEQVADFEQTLAEAYPADDLLPFGTRPRLFADGIVDTPWRLATAYVADRPVATAAVYATDRVAAIEAVATRPAARGQGLGALLTGTAAAEASGVPAALLASDSGRPVYAGLGFVPVMRFTLWIGVR